jgi:hypothetical protein
MVKIKKILRFMRSNNMSYFHLLQIAIIEITEDILFVQLITTQTIKVSGKNVKNVKANIL